MTRIECEYYEGRGGNHHCGEMSSIFECHSSLPASSFMAMWIQCLILVKEKGKREREGEGTGEGTGEGIGEGMGEGRGEEGRGGREGGRGK